MDNDQIDTALVERVALALLNANRGSAFNVLAQSEERFRIQARAVIYPPAPPKTRLQVARELLAKQDAERGMDRLAQFRLDGRYDNDAETAAVLAALALPAMED